jgi:hypothetical protein
LIFLIVSFLLLCDKSEEFLRVTIRKYALSLKRKVLWRKKARRPPRVTSNTPWRLHIGSRREARFMAYSRQKPSYFRNSYIRNCYEGMT